MPRWVSRIGAGMAKITVEIRPGTTPRPNRTGSGSDRRRSAASASGRAPAAAPCRARPVRRGDAERHADQPCRHRGGDDHQRQRLDRLLPVAQVDDAAAARRRTRARAARSGAGARRAPRPAATISERRRHSSRAAIRPSISAADRPARCTSKNQSHASLRQSTNGLIQLPDGIL